MSYRAQSKYGGMYAYGKAIAFNIVTANVYHAFGLRTAGDIVAGSLKGFDFYAGRIVDPNILNEINPSGNILQIECNVAHGLVDNDIVTLGNMLNAGHNGVTKITKIDATKFNCQNITYVAGAGASSGVVYTPAYVKALTGSAGVYGCLIAIDGTAAQLNKDWKWEANVEIAPKDNIVTERNSTNSLAGMATGGILTLADGDRVWVSGKNSSDTSDYTVKNFNLYVWRI